MHRKEQMMKVAAGLGLAGLAGTGCMGADVFLQTGQLASLGCVVAMLWATLRLRGETA